MKPEIAEWVAQTDADLATAQRDAETLKMLL